MSKTITFLLLKTSVYVCFQCLRRTNSVQNKRFHNWLEILVSIFPLPAIFKFCIYAINFVP